MKIKEGIIIQKIDDEYILIDSGIVSPAFNGMIKLNSTSKEIIELLQVNDLTEEEITDKLLEKYQEKREVILDSVKSLIKELSKTSILIK